VEVALALATRDASRGVLPAIEATLAGAGYDAGVDTADVIRLPVVYRAAEHALAELVAASELFAGGRARRVVISRVAGVDAVRGGALLHAQATHVAFSLRRTARAAPAGVGPREP
jgi:hypothetical protein